MGVAALGREVVQRLSLFEGCEVFALDVLDQCDLDDLVIVYVTDGNAGRAAGR